MNPKPQKEKDLEHLKKKQEENYLELRVWLGTSQKI